MRRALLCAAIWFSAAQSASAQTCNSYVGSNLSWMTFDEAASKLPKIAPKDEFESTADYQKRIAEVAPSEPFVIGANMGAEPFGVSYDADRQVLIVKDYAFEAGFVAWSRAMSWSDVGLDASRGYNAAAVLDQSRQTVGTYEAQTALGVKFQVQEVQMQTNGIFDRALNLGERLFGKDAEPFAEIPMDPTSARAKKPALSRVVIAVPKAPFFFEVDYTHGTPSLDTPTRVRDHLRVIVADIQCALILDADNIALAAVETK